MCARESINCLHRVNQIPTRETHQIDCSPSRTLLAVRRPPSPLVDSLPHHSCIKCPANVERYANLFFLSIIASGDTLSFSCTIGGLPFVCSCTKYVQMVDEEKDSSITESLAWNFVFDCIIRVPPFRGIIQQRFRHCQAECCQPPVVR